MTQFVLRFYKDDRQLQYNQVRVHRILKDGDTKTILLDARIPGEEFNKVTVVFWNSEGEKKIIIDNLKLICF